MIGQGTFVAAPLRHPAGDDFLPRTIHLTSQNVDLPPQVPRNSNELVSPFLVFVITTQQPQAHLFPSCFKETQLPLTTVQGVLLSLNTYSEAVFRYDRVDAV